VVVIISLHGFSAIIKNVATNFSNVIREEKQSSKHQVESASLLTAKLAMPAQNLNRLISLWILRFLTILITSTFMKTLCELFKKHSLIQEWVIQH
jgi:hypothetical protein